MEEAERKHTYSVCLTDSENDMGKELALLYDNDFSTTIGAAIMLLYTHRNNPAVSDFFSVVQRKEALRKSFLKAQQYREKQLAEKELLQIAKQGADAIKAAERKKILSEKYSAYLKGLNDLVENRNAKRKEELAEKKVKNNE